MLRQAVATPSRIARSALRAAGQQRIPSSAPRFWQLPLSAVSRPVRTTSIRWYSAEPESKDAAKDAAKDGEAAAADASPEAALKKELETKSKEALEWKDRYLRSVADFRNLQDRQAREMKSTRDFAIQKFARDLVDSVDNLERALAMVPADKIKAASDAAKDSETKPEFLQDLVNLYEGLKMTENILVSTVAKHGLERFNPNGEKFNPNEHEATFMTPQPDKDDNTVFFTQQTGFKLNGRVIRPAKVGVVKNS
ncbi:hypothetical protein PspLS_00871 [Pyricularia sp. CBS 133598]|nr:hypothetical protein PspLS_00871 [Pyricularia sp. CBS 133598]